MPSVTCLGLAAGLLLVVAGADKVARPQALHRAVRSLGWSARIVAVRVVALAELAVGCWAVIAGGAVAWTAVAAAYVVLTAFVGVVRHRSGGSAPCGCFGERSGRASRSHVVLTAACAGIAGAAAVTHTPGLVGVQGTGARVAVLLAAAVVGYLGHAVLAVLPAARRSAEVT